MNDAVQQVVDEVLSWRLIHPEGAELDNPHDVLESCKGHGLGPLDTARALLLCFPSDKPLPEPLASCPELAEIRELMGDARAEAGL